MSDIPAEPINLSYSRQETPGEVWRNRVGVTGTLFALAMSLSYVLGSNR